MFQFFEKQFYFPAVFIQLSNGGGIEFKIVSNKFKAALLFFVPPCIPEKTFQVIRNNFSRIIILSNGLTPETGEKALHAGFADLVAFGRSFLSNPDFVEKIKAGEALNPVDYAHLYTPGSVGYIDYPVIRSAHTQKLKTSLGCTL